MPAAVGEAVLERAPRGGELVRALLGGELAPGVQAEQVRHVAVARLGLLEGPRPLHQAAVRADLRRGEAAASGPHPADERVVLDPSASAASSVLVNTSQTICWSMAAPIETA